MTWLLAADPIKWTDYVNASSSAFSAIVASIAAHFAYRAYTKQAGQLQLAQKHDLRWQSAKVTGWLDKESTLGSLGLKDLSDRPLPQVAFWFHNASDLPVYDVQVLLKNRSGIIETVKTYETFVPTEEPSLHWVVVPWAFEESYRLANTLYDSMSEEAKEPYGGASPMAFLFDMTEELPPSAIELKTINLKIRNKLTEEVDWLKSSMVVTFRDSEGNYWIRQSDGRLEEEIV